MSSERLITAGAAEVDKTIHGVILLVFGSQMDCTCRECLGTKAKILVSALDAVGMQIVELASCKDEPNAKVPM